MQGRYISVSIARLYHTKLNPCLKLPGKTHVHILGTSGLDLGFFYSNFQVVLWSFKNVFGHVLYLIKLWYLSLNVGNLCNKYIMYVIKRGDLKFTHVFAIENDIWIHLKGLLKTISGRFQCALTKNKWPWTQRSKQHTNCKITYVKLCHEGTMEPWHDLKTI